MTVTPVQLGTSVRPDHDRGVAEPGAAGQRAVADDRSRSARRRRRPSGALGVGSSTLLVGLTVALADGTALLPMGCAVVLAALAGLRSTDAHRHVPAGGRVRADLRVAAGLALVLSVLGVVGLAPLGQVRGALTVVVASLLTTVALRAIRTPDDEVRRVVLVGAQDDVQRYAASLRNRALEVVGAVVVDAAPAPLGRSTLGFPVTQALDGVAHLVSGFRADAVFVLPGRAVDSDVVRRVSWALDRSPARLAVVCPVAQVSGHRMRPTVVGETTVLGLDPVRTPPIATLAKTLIDRVGAGLLLVLLAPLLAVLVVAVRLDSPGPAFFVQSRVGRRGQLFRMFKLRSMHLDAEDRKLALMAENEADGALFKIRRDPRVTRFGYWLRRSSLDELPQLLNVVRGDMSLVGPRPALPDEVADYDEMALRRLLVKPGITGLWQVSGRSDLCWEESIQLDLYYAENWRLRDDFAIAARTLGAVVQARGAY